MNGGSTIYGGKKFNASGPTSPVALNHIGDFPKGESSPDRQLCLP
jgi:hypothetical protein